MAENRLTVTGEKGYCMIRATHGMQAASLVCLKLYVFCGIQVSLVGRGIMR